MRDVVVLVGDQHQGFIVVQEVEHLLVSLGVAALAPTCGTVGEIGGDEAPVLV